ncbi:HNH endonuclease signature motif containing protein [Acutalibacter sp. 1XD8-36]|uniref:HNH endonuclease signature motif containing protein n=1 Tax=Acutalibacter sp. 1XD8-36 TaxID=2320852 RepID=UPI0014130E07|nr:HNH endonuclease signature motif containing protein [Acutalibacter sp. 1XD8-36]NBJ87903.1 HNH endonuclease [Acutalibacter sp. 1XD8-36]
MRKKVLELNAECQQCGKRFHVKPSALKHTKFCSKECHDIAQTKGEIISCATCGKEFRVSPSLLRERNFCSNECRLKWLSKHVKEEMNVPGHSVRHKAPHLTALNQERNPKLALEQDAAYRGIYTNHRRIMEQHLGRKLKPWEDVHHINGIHSDNRIENLVVMPHREHMKLHWRLAKERGVI